MEGKSQAADQNNRDQFEDLPLVDEDRFPLKTVVELVAFNEELYDEAFKQEMVSLFLKVQNLFQPTAYLILRIY